MGLFDTLVQWYLTKKQMDQANRDPKITNASTPQEDWLFGAMKNAYENPSPARQMVQNYAGQYLQGMQNPNPTGFQFMSKNLKGQPFAGGIKMPTIDLSKSAFPATTTKPTTPPPGGGGGAGGPGGGGGGAKNPDNKFGGAGTGGTGGKGGFGDLENLPSTGTGGSPVSFESIKDWYERNKSWIDPAVTLAFGAVTPGTILQFVNGLRNRNDNTLPTKNPNYPQDILTPAGTPPGQAPRGNWTPGGYDPSGNNTLGDWQQEWDRGLREGGSGGGSGPGMGGYNGGLDDWLRGMGR